MILVPSQRDDICWTRQQLHGLRLSWIASKVFPVIVLTLGPIAPSWLHSMGCFYFLCWTTYSLMSPATQKCLPSSKEVYNRYIWHFIPQCICWTAFGDSRLSTLALVTFLLLIIPHLPRRHSSCHSNYRKHVIQYTVYEPIWDKFYVWHARISLNV